MTTYHITLDRPSDPERPTSNRHDIKGYTAADAMQKALKKFPGTTVIACCAGGLGVKGFIGVVNYEIPKHSPYVAPPKPEKHPDLFKMDVNSAKSMQKFLNRKTDQP